MTSAHTNRAQHWLEPYTQCLKLGQWNSQTTLAALSRVVAKQVQPPKVAPGGGARAAAPRPSTTHSTTAPTLGAVIFPLVPNLGIGNSIQDDDVIMENAAIVPQASSAHATAKVSLTSLVHDTAMVPSASLVYTTATVPQASSVNATTMVPQALSVNVATTVLKALSAYDTASASGIASTCYCNGASGIISKCCHNGASGIVRKHGHNSASGIIGKCIDIHGCQCS